MNLEKIFEKIIKTTPLEYVDLKQFVGLSVPQIWNKIDDFLAEFGLKTYCISSLDPTKREFFEGFEGKAGSIEYNILGLRRLNSEDTILFDDVIYLLSNCNKVTASKRMLFDFFERVSIISTFGLQTDKLNEYCPVCNGEIEVAYKGFVIHQCPDCKSELKPCSICDAYTDNEVKTYAPSCSQCPFDKDC